MLILKGPSKGSAERRAEDMAAQPQRLGTRGDLGSLGREAARGGGKRTSRGRPEDWPGHGIRLPKGTLEATAWPALPGMAGACRLAPGTVEREPPSRLSCIRHGPQVTCTPWPLCRCHSGLGRANISGLQSLAACTQKWGCGVTVQFYFCIFEDLSAVFHRG